MKEIGRQRTKTAGRNLAPGDKTRSTFEHLKAKYLSADLSTRADFLAWCALSDADIEPSAKTKAPERDSSDMPVSDWLAIRNEAALRIDPETAEVEWSYGQILDPYGINPNLPREAYCVGRIYFARSAPDNVWVCFYDLPDKARDALWAKIKEGQLSFNAFDLFDDFQ